MMIYEIEEVIEHLQEVSDRITPESFIDEEEFKVRLGHVYAHLNLLWNSRNHIGELSSEQSEQYKQLPNDITLYG